MVNVDFTFDFEKAFAEAFADDEVYQNISYFAKCFNVSPETAENALRLLAEANTKVFSKVMEKYNRELLNEIEL